MADARASADHEVEVLAVTREDAADHQCRSLDWIGELDLGVQPVRIAGVLVLPGRSGDEQLAVDAAVAGSGDGHCFVQEEASRG